MEKFMQKWRIRFIPFKIILSVGIGIYIFSVYGITIGALLGVVLYGILSVLTFLMRICGNLAVGALLFVFVVILYAVGYMLLSEQTMLIISASICGIAVIADIVAIVRLVMINKKDKERDEQYDRSMKAIEKSYNNEQSGAEQLKEYKELLDMGAISQKEFNKKKKQLLK